MVSISQESVPAAERRLRGVVRDSSAVHLPGVWAFNRSLRPDVDGAIAAVKDDDGWSALVPADASARERFALSSFEFPPDADNSGFVGWLASTIKNELGSGVFVVCGDNPERGGIFDYWGYPIEIADTVRDLIDRLRGDERSLDSLDFRTFRVTATSPGSAISPDTTFEFRERDGRVEATYRGGQIVAGHFLGRRSAQGAEVAYVQLHADGQLKTGTSTLRIDRLTSERLRITEDYTWVDGGRGQNVLETVNR